MNEFWENRYKEEEFIYGMEPNVFFKDQLDMLTPGKVILAGEGEGRNAVYAAKQGWEVTAIDFSINAQKKALALAERENVSFNYIVSCLEEFDYQENKYDVAAIIFSHFLPAPRKKIHFGLLNSLKKGGIFLLEGFHKNQIEYDSGGPKDEKMLYNLRELFADFPNLKILRATKMKTKLNEGKYHQGLAEVVRLVGVKME